MRDPILDITTDIIRGVFGCYHRIVFAQIGVGDWCADNLLKRLVNEDGRYEGYFVSPAAHIIGKLGKRGIIRGNARFTLVKLAVSGERGKRPFYYVREDFKELDSKLPDYLAHVGGFNKKIFLGHLRFLRGMDVKKYARVRREPVVRINWFLSRYNLADRLNLLVISTPGEAYNILRAMDFKLYGPRAIVYQHGELRGLQTQRVRHTLSINGYRLQTIGPDTIAILK